MKPNIVVAFLSLLFAATVSAQVANPTIPEALKPQFVILNSAYPKVDSKKFPKAPADSVWQFRSATVSAGTVEVGFQGADVVYMIFRRGTGGTGWKPAEIRAIHIFYHKELLKETYEPYPDRFSRYNDMVAPQINAAVITRKDFDAKSLFSGS